MYDVTDLVALAQPDRIPEVISDDAEVITVIGDVGGKEAAVAPGDYRLLAPVRCLPIHFGSKLVGLDESRHGRGIVADPGEEEDYSLGAAGVTRQGRFTDPTALDRPVDERQGDGAVPGLGGKEEREHDAGR